MTTSKSRPVYPTRGPDDGSSSSSAGWGSGAAIGTKPTWKPNARPIFCRVSDVGLASPRSMSATWRVVSLKSIANSGCDSPSA